MENNLTITAAKEMNPQNRLLQKIEKHKKNNSVLRRTAAYIGPAFVVSVAYVDPGNFAANIGGGSEFGYQLLWVILWSNLMAIFLQTLSAKLGIATGRNLPNLCGQYLPKPANTILFGVSVLTTMATTMAEFLGGVLGLYLLFHIPLILGGLITGVISYIIAHLQKFGQRVIEVIVGLFLAVICLSYGLEVFLAKPDWNEAAVHVLLPTLSNGRSLFLAASMLGATVMPHAIYLHSQLVQERKIENDTITDRKKHYSLERLDIGIAMNAAFFINAAMVIVSAAVFHSNGIRVETINDAHASLAPLLGTLSSGAFGLALLCSGFSASTVGAIAGETMMGGFVKVKLPISIRRLIALLPGMAVLCLGINPMDALIFSQVALSFALPFAIFPLLYFSGKRAVMGELTNRPITKTIGWLVAGLVLCLNAALIGLTLLGKV